MIFRSPLPPVSIPEVDLSTSVFAEADRLADKVAVVDAENGHAWTFRQLAVTAQQLSTHLASRGVRKGDVVAIVAPNVPEYPIVFHAVAMAGGVITTLNPMYTEDEMTFQFMDSGTRLVITTSELFDKAQRAARKATVEHVITIDSVVASSSTAPLSILGGPRPAAINPERDLVALPYSSGTTGLSKGVMLTHRNLVANLIQADAVQQIDEDERILAVLPFFHIYGMTVIMNQALRQGATLVTMRRFEFGPYLRAIQDHRITRLYVTPPIVVSLAKSPEVEEYDLSSVRIVYSGAAPLDAKMALVCAQRLRTRVGQGYGLTETSPVTHCVPFRAPLGDLGSVGFAIPNTECKILDVNTGEQLGRNMDGEICIHGPQIMQGYLNNPTATREAIDSEGFLHTGDIGHIDDLDQYFIVDRIKELIKYKGFQVPPAELEALLLSHPSVLDAAVIGISDDTGQEIPKGFVVLRQPATTEELLTFVAERVAPHKKIRQLAFVDEIPKSPSGKILRRVLREREGSPTSAFDES